MIGYSPWIVVHKKRNGASLSATSIGTEENSLGVPKAQSGALIYMKAVKHRQHIEIQVQRDMSSLSK